MNEYAPPSLQEVWDWKKKSEDETRGLSRAQLIEFYRQAGSDFEKKLGVNLPKASRDAGQTMPSPSSKKS